MTAAQRGDVAKVGKLLWAMVDIEARDNYYKGGLSQRGYTALHRSALNGDDACLKLLLEAGADITAKNEVREGWGVVLAVAREVAVGWW